ncbi:MAG: DUF1926 domain-containing protein [Pirellulales bacterium]|nr:DUF1926 domain-containing protein [Pirellulales bacterium]
MTQPIRLCLVLHNHQPIGNFDHVMEEAYQDSYLPFLDVYERYPDLKIGLHTSGSLMEWLDERHPEYVDRLANLAQQGRIEIIGGAFFEPILTMLPSRDRIGQIKRYSQWLEQRMGTPVQGMWIPERVWEQSLTRDIADAGIQYTILDDFHFKCAGLVDEQLHGYYVTEDDGRLLSIFPGSERLRYTIPFASPQETIDYLGQIHQQQEGAVVVFGDDGEKFGTWPDTKKHCYEDGWLTQFFDALCANRHWIDITTLSAAIESVPPMGRVYLPDSSYREMTEWALPAAQILKFEHAKHELEHDPRWPNIAPFVRGGFWRNFKAKYAETNEMYARMMMISGKLDEATRTGASPELVEQARLELYRGQCNCSYWHGAFGGIYLPHLRNAVYRHLILADNLLERALGKPPHWMEATAGDWNLDSRQEVELANDKFVALIAPAEGGQLYELDVRSIAHNLLATLMRRPEAYHQKVLAGANENQDEAASIHDRVVFKQADLDQRLQYDAHPRKSLIDHFWDADATLESVLTGTAAERGDFVGGVYDARLRRKQDRSQAVLSRQGNAHGIPLKITKGITVEAGSGTLEIAYMLEGLPRESRLHFGVELNFAGLPAGADDRFFYDRDEQRLGDLGTRLDVPATQGVGLVDQWLGVDVGLAFSRPSGLWTFPIETVSQSEAGFELVHQSVVVMPHWIVEPDAEGRWTVTITMVIDTEKAESREPTVEAMAGVT